MADPHLPTAAPCHISDTSWRAGPPLPSPLRNRRTFRAGSWPGDGSPTAQREPQSRRGRAQTRHLSTFLTRFFDSNHPARARDLSTQVRHQCRKVRLAAPPSAWGCRPPPRGGSREPASQPTESGSPRLHTQPAHQGRRGRRSVGRPRRASHRTTFRGARGGSVSPVVRHGPGGSVSELVSSLPARSVESLRSGHQS